MVQKFALIFGIVYLAIGILGFIPGIVQPASPEPGMAMDGMHGRLLGLFPVNALHNLFHMAIGIWGIVAYRGWKASVRYAQSVAVIFAVLAILGLFPVTRTFFGLIPLYSHDIWLHALTAIISGYFGFAAPARTPARV